jgi:tripartite-type tricarboxylate transporter receptor subunit TctC
MVAPAGMPPAVTRRLSDSVLKALDSADVKAQMASLELQPMPLPAPAFGQLLHDELPLWTQFVRQLGIQVEF